MFPMWTLALNCETIIMINTSKLVLDDQGVGVRVSVGARVFSMSSRPVLGPTELPIHWVPGALSPVAKRLERGEADHSQLVPISRKRGFINPLSHTPSWRSALLVKHRDNFTLIIITVTVQ
jgi:hypothetical protein